MITWKLEKIYQSIYDTLDHAESQPVEKTNIRQNVRWCSSMDDETICPVQQENIDQMNFPILEYFRVSKMLNLLFFGFFYFCLSTECETNPPPKE